MGAATAYPSQLARPIRHFDRPYDPASLGS
jgi:hypothetical protein